MTQPLPTVSVIMPLYNKARYVEAAIESVLAQSTWLHELIVVDDGSTDGSADRVQALKQAHPGIVLLQQANAGVSAARNRGVSASHGEYVAFLDADDLYRPGFLQEIVRLIERYPNAGLYATGYERFSGEAPAGAVGSPPPDGGFSELVPSFFAAWARGPFCYTSSICVRRQSLLALGTGFPVGEGLGEDQDVWFRLAERHSLAFSPRPLALYRVDVAGSLTASTPLADLLPCYARLGVRLKSDAYPPQHLRDARRLLASHVLNIARARAAHGDFAGAWQLLADRRARGHGSYWLRTSAWMLWQRARAGAGEAA
jgi:glycosyltransferase involved in cell wall biosynthesis